MANPLSSRRPLPEAREPAVASMALPREYSDESEQSEVMVRDQLSLESEDEPERQHNLGMEVPQSPALATDFAMRELLTPSPTTDFGMEELLDPLTSLSTTDFGMEELLGPLTPPSMTDFSMGELLTPPTPRPPPSTPDIAMQEPPPPYLPSEPRHDSRTTSPLPASSHRSDLRIQEPPSPELQDDTGTQASQGSSSAARPHRWIWGEPAPSPMRAEGRPGAVGEVERTNDPQTYQPIFQERAEALRSIYSLVSDIYRMNEPLSAFIERMIEDLEDGEGGVEHDD